MLTIAMPSLAYDGNNPIFKLVMEHLQEPLSWKQRWQIVQGSDQTQPWLYLINNEEAPPKQGWKLHISGSILSAESILHHVLPILLEHNASFKIAASLQMLDYLNHGGGGYTQIGKFITVYPRNDEQAIVLATILHETLEGKNIYGPAIPSDRPLKAASLVYYRYGSFDKKFVQTPLGEFIPGIYTTEGDLVPDQREALYIAPKWLTDPFITAGIADNLSLEHYLIKERYLLMKQLHQSPRGTVYLAIDIKEARTCVLKQARHHGVIDYNGNDACDRLRYEAKVLTHLQTFSCAPELFELFYFEDDLYLALEDIEGPTLEIYSNAHIQQGEFLAAKHIVAWGKELATILATLHDQGFIYRDLKASNIIVTPNGTLRLLDFEAAFNGESSDHFFCHGTRGYLSPQQDAGKPPAITDDIYSLGALLYFLATASEPSLAPQPNNLLARPIEWLNSQIGSALLSIIMRCLDPQPQQRFPSMIALTEALSQLDETDLEAPLAPFGRMSPIPIDGKPAAFGTWARKLGDTLCSMRQCGNQGVYWMSTHHTTNGACSRNINAGNSGTLLALAELVGAFNTVTHREILAEGARWLMQDGAGLSHALPGLYIGEAGVGTSLLRAGQILEKQEYISHALDYGRWIATLPHVSPDLFHGTAGRLLFHLLLWDETQDAGQLEAAVAAGDWLLASAEYSDNNEIRWPIPQGYAALSGHAYSGYAHGAAGIADMLLELFKVSQDKRYLAVVQNVAHKLINLAMSAYNGAGVVWSSTENGPAGGNFWCHGAIGIGVFLLHCSQYNITPLSLDIAKKAAYTAARSIRWSSPTQCHGLAGSIEFLLDFYQATKEKSYLNEALSLASLLMMFKGEQQDHTVWPSEFPTTITPDYMVGYAGVAMCLLRLDEPTLRPRQLSRPGFRYRW